MRAELFDAGSVLNIVPTMEVPGMNDAYFREIDMEQKWPGEFAAQINDELRTTPLRKSLLPWPEPFPARCWIDWTPRYAGQDGGFKINTVRYEMMFEQYSDVSGKITQIPKDADYDPILDINDERVADAKTVAEIQADHDHPTKWLRRKLYNEPGGKNGGYCDLLQPTSLVQNHHIGDEFRPVINYSPLFAPVDLRHPEWYDVLDSAGNEIPDSERRMSMRQDGRYRLYLRPANWRWVATVWAYYIYASWFEMIYTKEVFTTAWFNRPPIYPRRHDLIHTTTNPNFEYQGTLYSTDVGISSGFELSRGAKFLRQQIINAQWWTYSEVYVFVDNDPATLALWMYPPDHGDIVLGIGQIDDATGEEQVVWLRQNRNLTSTYPRTVIGSYAIPEFSAVG